MGEADLDLPRLLTPGLGCDRDRDRDRRGLSDRSGGGGDADLDLPRLLTPGLGWGRDRDRNRDRRGLSDRSGDGGGDLVLIRRALSRLLDLEVTRGGRLEVVVEVRKRMEGERAAGGTDSRDLKGGLKEGMSLGLECRKMGLEFWCVALEEIRREGFDPRRKCSADEVGPA